MASKREVETDFETTLSELELIVQQMETGELSLEQSLQHFEKGVMLTRVCQSVLSQAEQRVRILLPDSTETDFATKVEA